MSHDTHRPVRSFVRRAGRTTRAQARALEQLWPEYGVAETGGALDLDACFGRRRQRVLEIGFGNGEALAALAGRNPAIDYLGIEVHDPGIGHLLLLLDRASLGNVRLLRGDAAEIVAERIGDACLAAVNIFFPDPWPKKRHHKRRLVQPPFIEQLARCLEAGGILHLATDWDPYAEHMAAVMEQSRCFRSLSTEQLNAENPLLERPRTHFETRGLRLGHRVTDLIYRRA